MSLSQNPVMGKMAKSFANVNTYVHKGQNVVSAKAFNRKDKNTELQKAQRASFKLISDAWSLLGGVAENGFPVRPEKQSPFNYFMSLNLPNAIDTSGDVPVINYELLQVAKGTLPGVQVISATVNNAGITLNCNSNIGFSRKVAADDVITVVANTQAGALYVARQPRGTQEECSLQLSLPNVSSDDIQFVYAFVSSADGKRASNSVYVPINS